MAIKHIVLISWKDDAAEELVAAVPSKFDEMATALGDLARSFHYGADAGLMKGNADFSIIAEFNSAEDFKAYMGHPAHLKVIGELSKTILKSVSSSQVEV